MKGPYSGKAGTDWQLKPGTYLFSGTPDHCIGDLTFSNQSPQKVRIRQLETVAATGQSAPKKKGLKTLPPTAIRVAARMLPNQASCARAYLQLPPDTPAGRYQAELRVGEQKADLEIEVLENRSLDIEPGHVELSGGSGDSLSFTVTMTNYGNVNIDCRNIGLIWLREQDWIGRTLVYSLRETRPEDDYENFANRVLHNFRKETLAPLRVHFEPALKGPLPASERTQRILTLTLPEGLRKGRRYRGFIKIAEGRIWLDVYCNRGTVGRSNDQQQRPANPPDSTSGDRHEPGNP